MKKHTNKKRGFTMIELLVALTISSIVVLMSGLVFTHGVAQTRIIATESRLVDTATTITSILTLHIRPATNLHVEVTGDITRLKITSSGAIDIVEFDDTNKTLVLGTNSLLPTNISAETVDFLVIGNTVQISFTLDSELGDSQKYNVSPFSGTTTIAMRN